MSRTLIIVPLTALVVLGLSALGCDPARQGGNNNQITPGANELVILYPPGAEIGLGKSEAVRLRVRYRAPDGAPIADADIDFAIEGEAAGATLSGFSARTDAAGIAELNLTAGAADATFRVRATAPNAVGVAFDVAVSDAGFATLEVESIYDGDRRPGLFGKVETRLYFDLGCHGVSRAGTDTADRMRESSGFNTIAVFNNLPVDLGATVVVRGVSGNGVTLAWGCARVEPSQLIRGVSLRLHLVARDIFPSAVGDYTLQTDVELSTGAVPPIVSAFGPLADLGDCPLDPVEKLVDCVVDLAAPDGKADCVVESTDALVAVVDTRRGALGPSGCRSAIDPGGLESIEAALHGSIDATALAGYQALHDFAGGGWAGLRRIRLRSHLRVDAGPDPQTLYVWHDLRGIVFPDQPEVGEIDPAYLGAYLLDVPGLRATFSPLSSIPLSIPRHEMTLMLMAAARHAAFETHLAPAGLPPAMDELVAILVGALGDAQGRRGCAAISAALCEAQGLGDQCLGTTCDAATRLLGMRLREGIDAALAHHGPDLAWQGDFSVNDDDGDLRVDRLGDGAGWQVELLLGGDWLLPISVRTQGTRDSTPIP